MGLSDGLENGKSTGPADDARATDAGPRVPPFSTVVTSVDATGRRVRLACGRKDRIGVGSLFTIHHESAGGSDAVGVRARVVGADESESTAVLTTVEEGRPVEPGDRAELHLSEFQFHRAVRFPDAAGAVSTQAVEVCRRVRTRLDGDYRLRPVDGDAAADFTVAATAAGDAVEILDGRGGPLPNVRPLPVPKAGAAEEVIRRLSRLAAYSDVLAVENPTSPLRGKLTVELTGYQDDYDPSETPTPSPFPATDPVPTVEAGQWTFLRVRNTSDVTLNVCVLDLQPDWGVSQIYPRNPNLNSEPLGKGYTLLIPLRAKLKPGFSEGTDVIKVFATDGVVNLHVLEQPALDDPGAAPQSSNGASRAGGGLVFAHGVRPFGVVPEPARGAAADATPDPPRAWSDWVTAQVVLHIKAPADAPPAASAGSAGGGRSDGGSVFRLTMSPTDFRIEIGWNESSRAFDVRSTTPTGEVIESRFVPPVGPAEVESSLSSMPRAGEVMTRSATQREWADPLKGVGERLFNALFDGRLRVEYDRAIDRVVARRELLRVRLVEDDARLSWLPWEYLYDPARKDFVVLSGRTPLVRLRAGTPLRPPPPRLDELRVLFVGADVTGQLGCEPEFNALKDAGYDKPQGPSAPETARARGVTWMEPLANPTATQFLKAMEFLDFDAVHFSGTGVTTAVGPGENPSDQCLVLMRSDGAFMRPQDRVQPDQLVSGKQLAEALRRKPDLRLIFLNACRTEEFARSVSGSAVSVVGIRDKITVRAATVFAEKVYRALEPGVTVEEAVAKGRQAVDRDNPGGREWGLPVSYLGAPAGVAVGRSPGPTLYAAMPPDPASLLPTASTAPPAAPPPPDPVPRPSPKGRDAQRRVLELQRTFYTTTRDALSKLIAAGQSPNSYRVQLRKTEDALEQLESALAQLPS